MERILIATIGTAPAVLTETLWALGRRSPAWIPDRIEVITTLTGCSALERGLLRNVSPLHTLYPSGTALPPITVLVPIRDSAKTAIRARLLIWDPTTDDRKIVDDDPCVIDDVDDELAAACMGDLILDRVYSACQNGENQLHLSISGGRKTMSAHALFSLGLVGNPQDEASHVLMGEAFDGNRQFWHPEQGGLIHTREVQNAAREARLVPDDWPTPTLSPVEACQTLRLFTIAAPRYDFIPRLTGKSGKPAPLPRLSTIIAQMNLAGDWLRAPIMHLDATTNRARINGTEGLLDPMDFLWLRLLTTAAVEYWTSPRDHGQPAGAVTVARLIFGAPGNDHLNRLRQWYDMANLAATRGDSVTAKAAKRSSGLDGDSGVRNLKVKLLDWLAELREAHRRSAGSLAKQEMQLAEDLNKELTDGISDLRKHLAETFGLPLAQVLLPKSAGRSRPIEGIPQTVFCLGLSDFRGVKITER